MLNDIQNNMTIVKSTLFDGLWDKLGGLEFRRRRNKKIELAKKRVPTNPRTFKQKVVRLTYRQGIMQYHKLTDEEKAYYVQKYRKENLDAYRAFMKECLSKNLPTAIYEITIDNSANPNELNDFQVLLNISRDSQFFQDCQNNPCAFYFMNEELTAKIPFWLEEWDTVNYNARIWLKVPSIPANGTVKLYMLINPNRTMDESDGDKVFLFFDHFNTPDKWSLYTGASIHDSVLDYTLEGNAYVVEKTTKLPSRNIIIEHRAKVVSRIGPNAGIDIMLPTTIAGGNDANVSGNWYLVAFESRGYYKIYEHTETTYTKIREIGYRIPTGQWLRCKTVINETAGGVRIRFYVNDEVIDDFTDTTPITQQDGYLAFREGDMEHDWVFVRKYTEPEPTITYKKL